MKVSHESPVSILEYSKTYNDFDYCLVHLLHQCAGSARQLAYYNFYKFNRKLYDREVLLDNSIFELGKSFDPEQFHTSIIDIIQWISRKDFQQKPWVQYKVKLGMN